jgi:hypothetical protein
MYKNSVTNRNERIILLAGTYILFNLFLTLNLKSQIKVDSLPGWNTKSEALGNIQFYPSGNPLGFPQLSLYELEPLLLKFDIFGTIEEQLSYKIVHCNYDWSTSDLDAMEYMEGFEENTLYAFSGSFNTTVDYVHYQLKIPNNDIKFLLSGNYIIRVYNENKEELLSRRFIVYEPDVSIEMQLDIFQSQMYNDRQALNVKVIPERLGFSELMGNIKLSVIQNLNWHTNQYFEKYNTDGESNILFNNPGQIVFDGINEFRFFDIKSLKFISERVDYMEYQPPHYHVYLKADNLWGTRDYFSNVDLSGNFYIRNQESNDDDMLDADYVWVHFKLNTEIPLAADVYIDGLISDWQFGENFMEYNPETGNYQVSLFLKQGIYNYRYVTKEYKSGLVYRDITEGNYYQTGNDYRVFLYYRKLGEFNDRVIGYGLLSTGQEVKEYNKDEELNVIQQLLKEMAK